MIKLTKNERAKTKYKIYRRLGYSSKEAKKYRYRGVLYLLYSIIMKGKENEKNHQLN